MLLTSLQLFAQSTSAAPKKKGVLPETLFNLDFNGSFSFDNGNLTTGMPVKALIGSKNTGIIVGFQSCRFGEAKELKNIPVFPYFNLNPNYSFTYLYSSAGLDSNAMYTKNNGFSIRLGYQKSIFRGLYANVSADFCRIKSDVVHSYSNTVLSTGVIYNGYTYPEINRTMWGMRVNAGIGYTISIGKAKKFYLNYEIVYSIIDKSKSSQGKLNIIGGIGFRIGSPAKTSIDGIKEVNTVPVKL